MNDTVSFPWALVGVTTVLAAWFKARYWRRETYPLPPSPTYWPLIGNLPAMPTKNEHIGFMNLGKQLNSHIISLRMFGTLIVVINSLEDAVNLLERRSSIYSDRVCPSMLKEPALMHWPGLTTLIGYNQRWRQTRRLMHTWLHKKAAERFHPSQQVQARLLLQRLLNRSNGIVTSDDLDSEFHRTAAATLVNSVYGYNLRSNDDPFVIELKEAMDHAVQAVLISNFLVNLFPALVHVPEWLPGASWKRTAREWRIQKDHAVDSAYKWTKDQIANGTGDPCIIASLLEDAEKLGLEANEIDECVKDVAVSLLAAGTDTTTSALLVFVLAMLLFPEIQEKAQKEIDSVVGSKRLPTLSDRPKLAYIDRLLQEVLRWFPTLPSGFPHTCYQDDIYKGYRIPKGTIVFANAWAICRDQNIYSDPEEFNPDRFLLPGVPLAPAFGYGRRACPGIHYADTSLFISIVSILATFNIIPAKDEQGNNIPANLSEGSGHAIYRPDPFVVMLRPRSQEHIELIQSVI